MKATNPARKTLRLTSALLYIIAVLLLPGCAVYTPTKNGGVVSTTISEDIVTGMLDGVFGSAEQAPAQTQQRSEPTPRTIDFPPGVLADYSDAWFQPDGGLGMAYRGTFAVFDDRFEFRGENNVVIPYNSIYSITPTKSFWNGNRIQIVTTQSRPFFIFRNRDAAQIAQTLRGYAQRRIRSAL